MTVRRFENVEPESRIAVKIVGGKFVSCFPMPSPKPWEQTFRQHAVSLRAPVYRNLESGEHGIGEIARTAVDRL